jgi:homoserine dehydrogenase
MRSIGIGLIGWGTVGCGTIRALRENADMIGDRLGASLELRRVADLDLTTPRPVDLDSHLLTDNVELLLTDPAIDVVVELIGGIEPARTFILRALKNGKHVVTANKALLAHHGNEIFRAARENRRCIEFEAAVAGGIPLIKAFREGLAANRFESLYGILNGTANYILTRMTEEDLSFDKALTEAQGEGIAEADPALDVEGTDAAHKLAILAAIAFGGKVQFEDVYVEGISHIDPVDIQFAREFGYRLKLLAIGRTLNGKVEMRVHPTLIPSDHVLASVKGAYNAIHVTAHPVGSIMLYGLGAGMLPTGSAVAADIMDLARNLTSGVASRVPALGYLPERSHGIEVQPISEVSTCYYFRFSAMDSPGVLSQISGILGKYGISISAVIQKGRELQGAVPIVMLTHEARESGVKRALEEIDRLDVARDRTRLIRIENL